jgi:hypothetical protein
LAAALGLAVCALVGFPLQATAATPPAPTGHAPHWTPGHAPDAEEIARAVETVKADPNLATERKVRTLRWVDEAHPSPNGSGESLNWLFQFLGWFAQSARVLVWVAVAIVVGLGVIYLIRLLPATRRAAKSVQVAAPTHVQDLDIRPESLPDDVGAAARALWDRGEHRAALSLLYRGLLSRLAHVHKVPIRDSSTEGDCLRMSASRLRDPQRDYVARLIQIWQRAVYGDQQPEADSVHSLCDEFAPALDAP